MKPSKDASFSDTHSSRRPKPCFPSMPDLPRSLPRDAGWVTEVGDFVFVHLINHGVTPTSSSLSTRRRQSQAKGSAPRHHLFAPDARPDDGCLWLLLVRAGVGRRELTAFLKAAEKRLDGKVETTRATAAPEGVELLRVRGMRLAPLDVSGFAGFSVDGKLQEDPLECLQAFVMPGVARTMVK